MCTCDVTETSSETLPLFMRPIVSAIPPSATDLMTVFNLPLLVGIPADISIPNAEQKSNKKI